MRKKKLIKILESKLFKQMSDVSIKAMRFLAIAPQKAKGKGIGNYETFVVPELIKIITNGYESALDEGVMILSDHLRFSHQKKPFLKLYLKVAEQQTGRIFNLISENTNLSTLTESSKISINVVSKNLTNLTTYKLDTIVLKSITLIELVSLILSIISVILTIIFGVIPFIF